MKHVLKKIPVIYPAVRAIRSYIRRFTRPGIEQEIQKALRNRDTVSFVQVGSNDGQGGDPLHRLIMANAHWSGIFIEPVKFLFARLQQNYQGSARFTFENVAIGIENGVKKFYYVSDAARTAFGDELPFWFDQLGSFNKEHIIKYLDKVAPYIIEEELECITLPNLLARNQVQTVDLVHIDTEGFDYQVLKQVDLGRYHPTIILYEHQHLTGEEKAQAEQMLKSAGFRLKEYGWDTLAIRQTS